EIIPNAMERFGSDAIAVIGPAIGVCCYEIGEDLASQFEAKFGKKFIVRRDAKPHLDLVAIATQQLERSEVAELEAAHLCTFCHPDLFFSYRRDGSSGRQMSFISRH